MIGLTTEITRGIVKVPAWIRASRDIRKNICAIQRVRTANKIIDLGGVRV